MGILDAINKSTSTRYLTLIPLLETMRLCVQQKAELFVSMVTPSIASTPVWHPYPGKVEFSLALCTGMWVHSILPLLAITQSSSKCTRGSYRYFFTPLEGAFFIPKTSRDH